MSTTATRVTMKGNPVNLTGKEPQIGQPAPDATLTANDLSEVKLSSFKGKKIILSVVPSLDTPVCDLQTKRFNKEASGLADTVVLTVSMDLPFAQKRWCAATNTDKDVETWQCRVSTLSDHRQASLGQAYGVLIENLRLLTRAIFIIDSKGILRYKQIVTEITQEPNYEEVLQAVKKI